MAQTKNLCAQIPTALHAQVCAAREQSGCKQTEGCTIFRHERWANLRHLRYTT